LSDFAVDEFDGHHQGCPGAKIFPPAGNVTPNFLGGISQAVQKYRTGCSTDNGTFCSSHENSCSGTNHICRDLAANFEQPGYLFVIGIVM
jgi:hypothetical protein